MPRKRREKLALVWGLISVLLGSIVILLTLLVEEHYHPTTYRGALLIRFSDHLGIALLILGIVGIIVEFKNWRDYFEERLASTIRKKEFLQTLERDELKTLLKDVFQAYYKVRNLVYEDSFLEFFNTKIQDYIATPFREGISSLITVQRPGPDGCCIVTEDISYRCRKVDVESSTIQKEVLWSTDYTDIVGDLKDYCVTLQYPEQLPKNFSHPSGLPALNNGNIVFEKENPRLKKYDGAYGFRLSLEEFKEIDELHVHVHVEYAIPLGRFFAWVMNYPSRGFQAVFHYPEDVFEIVVETFGMDPMKKIEIRQPGAYSLSYDSWLLPDYGLAYQFRKPVPEGCKVSEKPEPLGILDPNSSLNATEKNSI